MFDWGLQRVWLIVDLLGLPSDILVFRSLTVLDREPNYIYLDIKFIPLRGILASLVVFCLFSSLLDLFRHILKIKGHKPSYVFQEFDQRLS